MGLLREFVEERARDVRSLAEIAHPSTKVRLLALAERYEKQLGMPSQAVRNINSTKPSFHAQRIENLR
jgi:hypothetical protein